MKRFWSAFKFWVTDSFASRGRSVRQSNALARTIKDASHVRGGDGGSARSATEAVLERAVEGSEQYYKSLHKDD